MTIDIVSQEASVFIEARETNGEPRGVVGGQADPVRVPSSASPRRSRRSCSTTDDVRFPRAKSAPAVACDEILRSGAVVGVSSLARAQCRPRVIRCRRRRPAPVQRSACALSLGKERCPPMRRRSRPRSSGSRVGEAPRQLSPSVAVRQRPLLSKSRSAPSSGRFGVYQVRSPANGPCIRLQERPKRTSAAASATNIRA